MSTLNGIPRYIIDKVNGATNIVHAYFDLDQNEFVSKDELTIRFDSQYDYYMKLHALDEEANEHQVVWTYSHKFFHLWTAESAVRKAAVVMR